MPWLDQQELHQVVEAILAATLDDRDKRPSLLLSLPAKYVSEKLPYNPLPRAQVESDLGVMNEEPVRSDGAFPLWQYLENCRVGAGPRREAAAFTAYRNLVARRQPVQKLALFVVAKPDQELDAEDAKAELVHENEDCVVDGGPFDRHPRHLPGIAVMLAGRDDARVGSLVDAGLFLRLDLGGPGDVDAMASLIRQRAPDFRKQFGGQPAAARPVPLVIPSTSPAPPRYLPYACDRIPNYGRLTQLTGRLAAYLIEGPEEEAHDAFHERTSREFLKGRAGIAPVSPGDPLSITWPPPSAAEIVSHLAPQLIPGFLASEPAQIWAELQPGLSHGVIKICCWGDAEYLEALFTALGEWEPPPEGKALWIGVSMIQPPAPDKTKTLPVNSRVQVLRPLAPVPSQDAEDWTNQALLRSLYPQEKRELLKNAIHDEVFQGGTIAELPMKKLAPRLYELLRQHFA